MITQLAIRDFQVHQGLDIELDPHVTTVVGSSDSGKSAVIRALRWLMTNKPSGDAFIRDGAREVSVAALCDGHTISRAKRQGNNEYVLDAQPLVAFGADVPEPVAAVLNISTDNFQGQHDAPYWFSESAGEVSRRLNEIVDLGIIDRTLANLASGLRQARARVDVSVERLRQAREAVHAAAFAKRMNAGLGAVEESNEKQVEITKNANALRVAIGGVQGYGEAQQRLTGAVCRGLGAITAGDLWAELGARVEKLWGVVENIRVLQDTANRPVPNTDALEVSDSVYRERRTRARALRTLLGEATEQEETTCQAKQRAVEAEANLKREMGRTCLLCGQTIPS